MPVTTLRALMDGVEAVQNTVDDRLRVYRWRPLWPETPALFNWMQPASMERKDTTKVREVIPLITRIAVPHGEPDEEAELLIDDLADAFRAVWDPECQTHGPFGGARHAERKSMAMVLEEFNEVSFLAIEFRTEVWIDRLLPA